MQPVVDFPVVDPESGLGPLVRVHPRILLWLVALHPRQEPLNHHGRNAMCGDLPAHPVMRRAEHDHIFGREPVLGATRFRQKMMSGCPADIVPAGIAAYLARFPAVLIKPGIVSLFAPVSGIGVFLVAFLLGAGFAHGSIDLRAAAAASLAGIAAGLFAVRQTLGHPAHRAQGRHERPLAATGTQPFRDFALLVRPLSGNRVHARESITWPAAKTSCFFQVS